MRLNKLLLILVLVCYVGVASAQTQSSTQKAKEFASYLEQQYTQFLSLESKTSSDAVLLVKDGYQKALQCLSVDKESLECRYYAGLFRGEMLALKQVNIKKELNLMIVDFEAVIAKDASYDHAGSHRALGHLYLSLPSLPVLGFSLKKDLVLAWDHASKALRFFPNDTENLYLAGLIRLEQNDDVSANLYFKKAQSFLGDYQGPKAEKNRLKLAIQKGLKSSHN